jgi:hypothetical protein
VVRVDAGRGRYDRGIQCGSGPRLVRRNVGSRGNDGIEAEPGAGLIAREAGRGSNHAGGKPGSYESGVQAFGGRGTRAGGCCFGFEGEQVSHRARAGRKFKVGGVDDFRREGSAASYVNGLSSVMGFVTASATGGSGLGASQIFGAREFVAGVIEHFIGPYLGCGVRTKLGDFLWDYDQDE